MLWGIEDEKTVSTLSSSTRYFWKVSLENTQEQGRKETLMHWLRGRNVDHGSFFSNHQNLRWDGMKNCDSHTVIMKNLPPKSDSVAWMRCISLFLLIPALVYLHETRPWGETAWKWVYRHWGWLPYKWKITLIGRSICIIKYITRKIEWKRLMSIANELLWKTAHLNLLLEDVGRCTI